MLEDGGSYRAVTRIRPVASTMTRQLANFTSSGAPPPPDHPPPPPPQTQFVAMDYKNSDYAKVTVKSPGTWKLVLMLAQGDTVVFTMFIITELTRFRFVQLLMR